MPEIARIGFGGGCHWCTEAVFQSLHSVNRVEQGFIASRPPDASYSEAVIVHFDPAAIPLEVLMKIHLRTHSSMSAHVMRGKYRSAVYVFDDAQSEVASNALMRLQEHFEAPLVTRVLPFASFRQSHERFQNYYMTAPDRPFCKTYIDPKLTLLKSAYSGHVRQVKTDAGVQS